MPAYPARPLLKRTVPKGFTLIELSIVLVIIGLIVGGVLTGRDLIRASEVRATITQVEKFNQAVNTFRAKYGYLPGDIKDPDASQFGFAARGKYAGEGDGNGSIEGVWADAANSHSGFCQPVGETTMFWKDLSQAKLIEGSFTAATSNVEPPAYFIPDPYFPSAKIGSGNYFYVWSGGGSFGTNTYSSGAINYFGLSLVTGVGGCNLYSTAGLSVNQAYGIDKKIDDGFPQTGRVTAQYDNSVISNNGYAVAAAGGTGVGAADTSATAGSSATCYDNSTALSGTPGVASAQQHYSLEISGGNNINCALSFQFQ